MKFEKINTVCNSGNYGFLEIKSEFYTLDERVKSLITFFSLYDYFA